MDKEQLLFNSGVLTGPRSGAEIPPRQLWQAKKNGLVVIECPQRIPCNPCFTSCPTQAVRPFADINDTPAVDYDKCTGCARCVASCPGLACFVVDLTWGRADQALIKLPYEMIPAPLAGDRVACLNRLGQEVCQSFINKVGEPLKDRTLVIQVPVPADLVHDIRAVKVLQAE